VLTASGLIVGWEIHTDVAHAVAGFGLLMLFASACIWLGTLIGVTARTPDSVQGVAFMTVFPLTFLANAFVPIEGLPDGLRQIAEWNPISALVVAAVAWSLAILAISVPLCIRRFQARTTD
jgi:ABC-2 type transport system permease protein